MVVITREENYWGGGRWKQGRLRNARGLWEVCFFILNALSPCLTKKVKFKQSPEGSEESYAGDCTPVRRNKCQGSVFRMSSER